MLSFVVIANALILAVALWVLRPAWRDSEMRSQSRGLLITVLVFLLSGSWGLYFYWSNWSWSTPAKNAEDRTPRSIAQLSRHLEREPQDASSWVALGRAYMDTQQLPLAIRAYQRAERLTDGTNIEALVGLAEALLLNDPQALSDRADHLLQRALQLDPQSPKALYYGALTALQRGQNAVAKQRFKTLLAQNPPAEIRAILTKQIQTLEVAATAETWQIRAVISVDAKLKIETTPGSSLFVIVRKPGSSGAPLAVKRLGVDLPQQVEITAADLMLQNQQVATGQEVEVIARISKSGQPRAVSGDPFARQLHVIDKSAPVINLRIDQVTP
jgi:cytochrome c-type biogenesis protein CcmH